MNEWMEELEKDENQAEFSELVHSYYQIAAMQVMQTLREKYKIPSNELDTIMCAIYARMFNEICYTLGAILKNGSSIDQIYSKNHLLNSLKVINKEFIIKNASDFYKE